MGLAAALAAQAPVLQVATTDGRIQAVTKIRGGGEAGYELEVAGTTRQIRAGELLSVHGVAVQSADLAALWLQGGDVVRGALVGGDAAGDRVTMLSPVFGNVVVPIDRLSAFVPAGNRGLGPHDLALPDGVDEALFTRARIGYDLVSGSLHRFTTAGVRFAAGDGDDGQLFQLRDFVALRIADAAPREEAPEAVLLTRTGDRLGVTVNAFTASGLSCQLEDGRRVDVRHGDLACLTFLGAGRFLSDLTPVDVNESGFDGPVLHPWRRDRAVMGGALLAADRAHAKGLGVHARSRLSFVVPEGAQAFWSRIALDDSAAALPFRAEVDVRVFRQDKVVFEHRGLLSGGKPKDTGLLTVQPGETIMLEIDFGRGRDLGDRVDWLSPVFLLAPRR